MNRPARLATLAALAVMAGGCGTVTTVTTVVSVRTERASAPFTLPPADGSAQARATPAQSPPSTATTTAPRTTPSPPTTSTPTRTLPLAGKTIGIDPGHNGHNADDLPFINHLIWNGREKETCNTTGTETDAGYTEAQFNFNVATDLAAKIRALGGTVVMTRHNNVGVGPCVNTRAQILNKAHVNVGIDIHGDGGPADGRGFAVLEPVADGPNDHVIGASERFGAQVVKSFLRLTGMPTSTYDGVNGVTHRDDLAGLNLTRVPVVLIECGNMRNSTDAALMTSAEWQRRAANALATAITHYLQ